MNKELFSSMREQMGPGEDVRAALAEKLAAPQKKRVPVGRYAAIAACAAVIIAAVPMFRIYQNRYECWALISRSSIHRDAVVEPFEPHSYVLADSLACWPEDASAPENSTAAGSGDEDQAMTSGELRDNMLEAGFTEEDVDAYLASGRQMTWAKWWKFYHLSEESGERDLEALLKFSQEEALAVNTGEAPVELPGGAFVDSVPDQSEAIMAYQNLMARFEEDYGQGRYPDWYGGAYIDEHAELIVNIVEGCEADGKLELKIQDWAGSSKIGFGSGSRLSLNELRELQDKVVETLDGLGLMNWGCGVNEETGQVELTLPKVTREALLRLAKLDPEGTAILVIVGEVMVEVLAEEPVQVAPSVSQATQPDPNAPVSNTPGVIVDADGAIAWEPQG